jgi:hypothetical protein
MPRVKKESVASEAPKEPWEPLSVPMGEKRKVLTASRTGERMVATEGKDHGFSSLSNIRSLRNPLKVSESGVSAKDAIELCQKAYHNVPIFKNTIEIMTEFSNAPLHFQGSDEKAIEFFTNWWKKVNSYDLADQFFRELNRSTNLFFYRMVHKFDAKDVLDTGAKYLIGKEIPVRYALLDPCSMKCNGASSFLNPSYSKVLNNYELARLKSPLTQQDKLLLKSFSPKDQEAIKKGRSDISIQIPEEKLVPVFAKKQDYEALTVPFFYPVLADINLKLEFKKADLAISKTTDYIILLLTMGAKKEDGGTDKNALAAMQELFASESVGRVIIADYTTKGDFIIPDLAKILGKGKYEAVNQDIAQGMMNIFFDTDQKFSNTIIKIKVFLERLNEGRRIFRDKFLIPEMERIAETLGFKEVPKPVFEKIDLEDKSQLLRVYTRLAEIGFLTPEEFFDISESGLLPQFEKSKIAQKEFKKHKDKGLYEPLIGGSKEPAAGTSGRPSGTKSPKAKNSTNKPSTNVSVKETKRKSDASYSFSELKTIYDKVTELVPIVEAEFKEYFGIKRLSQAKKDQAFQFVESIVISEKLKDWDKNVKGYVSGKKGLNVSDEIFEISEEHNIPVFQAAILFHGKTNKV